MVRTKTAPNSLNVTTVLIYLLLLGALGTYALPLQSVTLPALGKKSWSVQGIIKSLPKGAGRKQEKTASKSDFKMEYNFMDFLKEVSPKDQTKTNVKISPEFVLGILVPISILLSYLFVILSLFVAPIKKGAALIGLTLVSAICSSYAVLGTYYLSAVAQKAFQSSLAKIEGSPFAMITKNLIQEVTIQPEKGLFILLAAAVLAAAVGFYRRNQS